MVFSKSQVRKGPDGAGEIHSTGPGEEADSENRPVTDIPPTDDCGTFICNSEAMFRVRMDPKKFRKRSKFKQCRDLWISCGCNRLDGERKLTKTSTDKLFRFVHPQGVATPVCRTHKRITGIFFLSVAAFAGVVGLFSSREIDDHGEGAE